MGGTRHVGAAFVVMGVCCVALPGCGLILGSQGAAEHTQMELAPPTVVDEVGNPLAGGADARTEGDKAAAARADEKRARDAERGVTTTTSTIPPAEREFVPAASGAVKEGVLPVNDDEDSLLRDYLPATSPTGETPDEIDFWPRSFDPGAPRSPRSGYCEGVFRLVAAGDSLWKRFRVATPAARRLLVSEFVGSMRSLATVSSAEFAVGLNGMADEADVVLAGGAAEDGGLVATFMQSGGQQIGGQLQTVISDAATRCESASIGAADVGLPGFSIPSEELIRAQLGDD